MKLIIVLTLFASSLAELKTYDEFRTYSSGNYKTVSDYALELGFHSFDHEFKKFKLDQNRRYGSEEEEERRKFNFLKTLQFVEQHNKLYKSGEVSHEVGVTPFADMSEDEYLNTFSMPSPLLMNVTKVDDYVEYDPAVYETLPASFDWRDHGKVSPVKNQGACGSCWAFATNAMIESGYLIYHNQALTLSEQQLVDCTNTMCKGLYIDQALKYVLAHGVAQNAEYPYVGKPFACRDAPARFHAHIKGYKTMGMAAGHRTPASALEIMAAIKNNGPIGLMLDAFGNDFAFYKGGILTTGEAKWKASHAVTLVGWGQQNGQQYWTIKNSWGDHWGEKGFMRMARGKDLRGMEQYLYYPTY